LFFVIIVVIEPFVMVGRGITVFVTTVIGPP
jgi:hypothetical protein